MKKIIAFALVAFFAGAPAYGQIMKNTRTKAMDAAAISGRIAGGGYFCGVGEEDLDTFIVLAQSQFNDLAIDRVDRIVAQLEFSNNYSAWSAKPPTEGCDAFTAAFDAKLKELS